MPTTLHKCCCTSYTPSENECTVCPEGQTPTEWELTVAGMSLCCSWWYWENNYGGGIIRYDFVAFDLTGIDPNGTFCLYQCAYESCLWDSGPIPWTGTIKKFEGIALPSLPANKCGGTPDWTATSTEGSPTIWVRWILNMNPWYGFTGLVGIIESTNRGSLIVYRATPDCADNQEFAPTSDCFADRWSAQNNSTLQKWAWCSQVLQQVGVSSSTPFVGHDGGTVSLVKGCGD
jgi:hypothetical protein